MTTPTTHEQATAPATAAAAEKLKAPKNARVAAQKLHVAAQAKSRHKASPKAGKQPAGARPGSKTSKVLALLKRSGGATTLWELMKATGWQPHSVRGFLSGTLGKKMKLTVISMKVACITGSSQRSIITEWKPRLPLWPGSPPGLFFWHV